MAYASVQIIFFRRAIYMLPIVGTKIRRNFSLGVG